MARHPFIRQEWQRLFDVFAARLLDLRPESVLDVGTGSGALLSRLAHAGIETVGVEASHINPNDTPRVRADATTLPFSDGAFDWVTLRHVPHHLADVTAALAEAHRVARSGMLVAEPWFDSSVHTQRIAERWDKWWKRQHERTGQIHKPCLTADDLQAALPPDDYTISVETFRQVVTIPAEAIDDLSLPLAEKLDAADPDMEEWKQVRAAIHETGFTYNGTLIMTVRTGDSK